MNAPRRPTLPQWKIDLVREAIKIIEGEKGRSGGQFSAGGDGGRNPPELSANRSKKRVPGSYHPVPESYGNWLRTGDARRETAVQRLHAG